MKGFTITNDNLFGNKQHVLSHNQLCLSFINWLFCYLIGDENVTYLILIFFSSFIFKVGF